MGDDNKYDTGSENDYGEANVKKAWNKYSKRSKEKHIAGLANYDQAMKNKRDEIHTASFEEIFGDYNKAKQDQKDAEIRAYNKHTQNAGLQAAAYLGTAAISAKASFITLDDPNTAIPVTLALISASCLTPAFMAARSCKDGSAKEFAKGLCVPLLALPLILETVEPSYNNPYEFNTDQKDNVYYRGYEAAENTVSKSYESIKNLAKEHGLFLPEESDPSSP